MNRLLLDDFALHNPLDFLEDQLKRRPRSSIQEDDVCREIPSCEPPLMGYHRDSRSSGRSRRVLETLSPTHSPVRQFCGEKLGTFMVADDFEESNDLLWRGRSRLPSETCLSSNVLTSSDDLTL